LRDWVRWHEQYGDPDAPLSQRLAVVQRWIRRALDAGAATVVSACAGDGRDVLGARSDVPLRGRLVELDPGLAARARAAAPPGIEVVEADAGSTDAYAGSVPADLVLLCGIFGNVSDDDVRTTVLAAPMLCAPGATVIWTRHRREPDLTPSIRQWFADAGFEEVAFEGEAGSYAVGVARLVEPPIPFQLGRRLFTFRS
jgi:hypothetical protein